MSLLLVVTVTGLIVGTGLAATVGLCADREQFRQSIDRFDRKLASVAPYLGVAVAFFFAKQATNGLSLRLSRALDWNITDSLYGVEGLFVAQLQSAVPEAAYAFFSAMYMFGFPYLLIVPLVAYFLLPSQRRLKELLVAYVLNYIVGAVCYTLFIAYGPRNWVPSAVDGVMYQLYPQTQALTAAVSSNTDVFPSLHTSLSVVVLLFAWRTRRTYPRWFPIALVTTASIVLATMVLGIHWLSDVVGGVVLGAWSVVAATWIVSYVEDDMLVSSSDENEESIPSDIGE